MTNADDDIRGDDEQIVTTADDGPEAAPIDAPAEAPDTGEATPEEPALTEPEGAPEPCSAALVGGELAELRTEIGEARREIAELVTKREIENKMYEELVTLRTRDEVQRFLPLYRSIIAVLDRIGEFKNGEHDTLAVLTYLEEELLEILEHQGIEQIVTPMGFDPKLQRAIGHLEVDETDEIRVVGEGFRYEERVLRHQRVLLSPPKAPTPPLAEVEAVDDAVVETLPTESDAADPEPSEPR